MSRFTLYSAHWYGMKIVPTWNCVLLTEIIIEEFLRSVVVSILYSLICLTFNIHQRLMEVAELVLLSISLCNIKPAVTSKNRSYKNACKVSLLLPCCAISWQWQPFCLLVKDYQHVMWVIQRCVKKMLKNKQTNICANYWLCRYSEQSLLASVGERTWGLHQKDARAALLHVLWSTQAFIIMSKVHKHIGLGNIFPAQAKQFMWVWLGSNLFWFITAHWCF